MQLAAADEHRPELGQLARVPAEPVGLGVDDQELRRGDRLLEQFQAMRDTPSSGRHAEPLAATWLQTRDLMTGQLGSIAVTARERSRRLTAVAHDAEKARELDADTRRAWSAYSEQLRELVGDEYERAEQESWTKLQTELRRLERRRRTLNQTGL